MNWADSRKFRSRNLRLIQDLDSLFGVDCHTLFSERNSNLAASGLIHYCGYLRLDNLAAVEFDPDAGGLQSLWSPL
jgi:hypothetical protein